MTHLTPFHLQHFRRSLGILAHGLAGIASEDAPPAYVPAPAAHAEPMPWQASPESSAAIAITTTAPSVPMPAADGTVTGRGYFGGLPWTKEAMEKLAVAPVSAPAPAPTLATVVPLPTRAGAVHVEPGQRAMPTGARATDTGNNFALAATMQALRTADRVASAAPSANDTGNANPRGANYFQALPWSKAR